MAEVILLLVIKREDCEYKGFHGGRHHIYNRKTGSYEQLKQFKMVVSPEIVEIYLPNGEKALTHRTALRMQTNR